MTFELRKLLQADLKFPPAHTAIVVDSTTLHRQVDWILIVDRRTLVVVENPSEKQGIFKCAALEVTRCSVT